MEYFNKGGNYNVPLDYAKKAFSNSDPKKMAMFSNSQYDEDSKTFKIKCMDMNLYVKYPSGEIFYEDNTKLNKISLEILIIRFLVNANPVPESHKYITFKEIDGGHVYYSAFLKTSINRLISNFGNDIKKFEDIMEKIGAAKLNIGDIAYKIRFINDTYIAYVLWEGDEEIEPCGNILFDSNIKYYFNAEDIAVVGDMPFIRIFEELDKIK
ncbi:DUF3786 domain-containing protein [Romboutsia sp.]|uniref:DUF3786 domain-containing protein n=1 Tax=Romboutsia sp. TaxID=1965302 RepID=UPI002D0D2B05|nr:DUF3786 domain-containing protein [Romboutsia sp.]HSQ89407.1 DUF3786 domain-containing protein [Romboutsia sp.]